MEKSSPCTTVRNRLLMFLPMVLEKNTTILALGFIAHRAKNLRKSGLFPQFAMALPTVIRWTQSI